MVRLCVRACVQFGAQMVDYLAVYLPAKHIFRPVIERAVQCCGSSDHLQRKAGYVILGVSPPLCLVYMCVCACLCACV